MREWTGSLLRDQRGMIARHILKIGLVVVLVGVLLVEVGPILFAKFSTIQDAEEIADTAAVEYVQQRGDMDLVLSSLGNKLELMGYSDEEIQECVVRFLPEGSDQKTKVRVTVVKHTGSFILRHIGPLEKFTHVSSTKESSITSGS